MKKYLSILSIVFIAVVMNCTDGHAQFTEEVIQEKAKNFRSSMIKTNPLPILLWGPIIVAAEYRLLYEVSIAPQQSLVVGASYLGKGLILRIIENTDTSSSPPNFSLSGGRFQLAYKFHIVELDYMYKVYIGPYFSYSSAKFVETHQNFVNSYLRIEQWNVNCIVGYQTPMFTRKMDFDIFMGLGYRNNTLQVFDHTRTNKPINEVYDLAYPGHLKLIFGFNLGWVLK